MKKVLLLLVTCLMALSIQAQEKVKYSGQGMRFKYTVLTQDTLNYIVVTMTSEKQAFAQPTTLMFKTFEDDVIKMEGDVVDGNKKTAGVMVSGFMIPISERVFIAQFKISDEELELLRKGIKKVRLTTVPKQHEKEFSKDKLGVKLNNMFMNAREKRDSF